MLKDCMRVLSVQLLNFFNWNELRYTKDQKKRNNAILLGASFVILGIVLIGYIVGLSYSLTIMGLSDLIPAYMLAITSILILFFTILKASGVIFSTKDYEMLMSFPLKPAAVIASRFLSMYIGNVVFSCITMIPSAIVYIIYAKPSVLTYMVLGLSIFVIPLIPMTIASTIGAVITAVSARMKYKNLVSIVLYIGMFIGFFALSFTSNAMDMQQFEDISVMISDSMNSIYPLTTMFTKAVVELSVSAMIQFVGISLMVFIVFVILVGRNYTWIMSGLQSRYTKGNYVLKEAMVATPVRAFYQKEWKRYWSSSLYVMNTAVGFVMLIGVALALFIMGPEKMEEMLQIPDISEMIAGCAPLAIAVLVSITSTTVSSISLEGKQWWIPMSLPIPTKVVFDSKILVNLTLSLPSCLIASTLVACTIPFTVLGYGLLYVTPVVYSIFAAVVGLTVNARIPHFNWDNEAVVIKQSGAAFVSLVVGMGSTILPVVLLVTVGGAWREFFTLIITVIVAVITWYLYQLNNKMDLRKIGAK